LGVVGLWIGLLIGLVVVAAIVLYSWWKRMHPASGVRTSALGAQV
jgi:hypothetical protein